MSATMMPPGAPVAPMQPPPPAMVPNPAYQQWLQAKQAHDAIVAQNQQNQQAFDAAVALIKQDGVKGFRLDIEADSTVAADEMAEQASRTDFLGKFVPLMEQIVPVAQGNPPMASLAKEIVLFAVRGFKVARTMEEAVEKAFDAIAQMPPNPKISGQQPAKGGTQQNPAIEAAKVQADVHDTETKAQTDRLAIEQKQQQADVEAQIQRERMQAESAKDAADLMMERARLASQHQLGESKMLAQQARSTSGLV